MNLAFGSYLDTAEPRTLEANSPSHPYRVYSDRGGCCNYYDRGCQPLPWRDNVRGIVVATQAIHYFFPLQVPCRGLSGFYPPHGRFSRRTKFP